MSEFLLELFSEEIPSSMQYNAASDLLTQIEKGLKLQNISFSKSEVFCTARRIAIAIHDLPEKQEDSVEERRGPRVDAPEKAIDGFLSSTNLKISDLEKRTTNKGDFYFAVIKNKGQNVSSILESLVSEVLNSFVWPKSMKWGSHKIRWVRPLHSILCIFNAAPLNVKFGHLTSSDKTYGHRFMSSKEIKIRSISSYVKELNDNFVIVRKEDRINIIKEKIDEISNKFGIEVIEDKELLDEVAGLVEYPEVVIGKIDSKFIDLPEEVLITSMKKHQKYFCLRQKNKKIAPFFIAVSNVKLGKYKDNVIQGYEKVLRARLEDAKFFWDCDRKVALEDKVELLDKIIFHKNLGTVYDKVKRIEELSKLIAVWIPHANLMLVEKAARLAKIDLVTEMVGEFTNLQGVMGYYYSKDDNEEEVALAVKEHYSPVGPNDECPKHPLSIAVSLSDKVDSLVGLFLVNEKPTGSKDPYALRRAALGVIRIILENGLRIPLKLLFESAFSKYSDSIVKTIAKSEGKKILVKKQEVIAQLLEFFADRLKYFLKDQDIRHDLISSVFDDGDEDDLVRLVARVIALSQFIASESGENLLAAYKRATNIVESEEKKDKKEYNSNPEKSLLTELPETLLYGKFEEVKPKINKYLKDNEFIKAMSYLSTLRKPVDDFFDKVKVNVDDQNLRRNRLLILSQFRSILNQLANFSKIET